MTNTRNAKWLRRIADTLIRHRLAVLLVALGAAALAAIPASRLDFDQSIESLYATDDPHLQAYEESKALFGGDEFVIVAYTDAGLLSADGFRRLRAFAQSLSQVPGVRSKDTQNLADALNPPTSGLISQLLLNARKQMGNHRHEKELHELFRRILLGDDDQTTAVVLRLQPEDKTDTPRSRTISEIREIAARHDPPAFVVGESVQVHDIFRYVEEDGRNLFHVSLLVLAATIFVLFRSVRWMVLPLLVVVVAIAWTQALLVLSNMRLSMVSSMLDSLMTIIGIATVTHVTVHYRELRQKNGRVEAFLKAFVDLAPPVFWTCATTAVGFAALLSSHINPVQSFSIMMTLGVGMVLLASAMILPGGVLLGRFSPDPGNAPMEGRLIAFLDRMTRWVTHHPQMITIGAATVVVFVAMGFFRLKMETDFSKNFRASSPIRQALAFVETRLGGAGTWEVNFPASTADLDRVERIAEALRSSTAAKRGQLSKVVSLTDGLNLVPRNPFSKDPVEAKLEQLRAIQPTFESSLYNREEGRMRIVLRAREQEQSDSKLELIEDVGRVVQGEFPGAKVTGLFVLLTHLIESLLRDQFVSLALAAVGICAMMTLAFHSLRIGLVSLVPNLFPIVLVVGTMGWVGLPINIATAMIASVSMGLTVDSSIHYISGFRRARASGLSVADALQATHASVGRALVFANLALILGFSVLTLSHFIPLVYFGILVSVAMFGGLVGNLMLLPLLLKMAEGETEN